MKIAIAADHGGFALKQQLIDHYQKKNVELEDLGTYTPEPVDYPDYGVKMARHILDGRADLGIAICGTGVGISMAANRLKGIRAALLYDDVSAQMAKKHNNANIIAFGGRTMAFDDVVRRIDIFLQTEFEGGRHQKRIDKLDEE